MKKSTWPLLVVLCCTQVASAQNVGIGTNTPAYKLDVNGRMRVKTGTVGNIGTTSGIWLEDFRTANRDVVFMGMQDSIRWGLFGNGGVGWDGLIYNSRTGAVGLGIPPTSSALTIGGNGAANPQLSMHSANNLFAGGVTSNDSALVLFSDYGNSLCFPSPCVGTPAKDIIFNPPSSNLFAVRGSVGFFTRTPTTDFQIAGRVQVGSGAPAAGYQLSVNGRMICTEARVQSNAAWPDYVFESNYQLPTLESIEKHILQHKHLPGIPSAATVEQEGFDLGNMNRLLLEKIEELTLHLIDLKKENTKLAERIAKLEN
jgi:hypothetical protein